MFEFKQNVKCLKSKVLLIIKLALKQDRNWIAIRTIA